MVPIFLLQARKLLETEWIVFLIVDCYLFRLLNPENFFFLVENNAMETQYNYSNKVLLFPDIPVNYAGFWERFGAAFIDGLVLIIPNYFLIYALGPMGNVLSLVMAWLYFAIQESSNGQATLGKKAMGLKVATLDAERISFGQATGRHFGKYLSCLILLIGYLMMIWDENKQTLHDKMAGAIIIK